MTRLVEGLESSSLGVLIIYSERTGINDIIYHRDDGQKLIDYCNGGRW